MLNNLNLDDYESLKKVIEGAKITKEDLEDIHHADLGEYLEHHFIEDKMRIKCKCENGEFVISSTEANLRTFNPVDLRILQTVNDSIVRFKSNTKATDKSKSISFLILIVFIITIVIYYLTK